MASTTHTHPNPTLNRAVQYGAVVVAGLMVISAPLQVLLSFAGAPGGGFLLAAILTLLLALPVLMLTAVAPAVTVSEGGLTIAPVIWKRQTIQWDDIQMVKNFPLMPTADMEVNRRYLVGRKNYSPADGIMLLIPSLPLQYRIAGIFAGERGTPIIALTNRAHTDYETLVKQVLTYTDETTHDPELLHPA